jgi:hypothetical protein
MSLYQVLSRKETAMLGFTRRFGTKLLFFGLNVAVQLAIARAATHFFGNEPPPPQVVVLQPAEPEGHGKNRGDLAPATHVSYYHSPIDHDKNKKTPHRHTVR